MALRPAPDLDPRLSARHPLRKQRSAAGREPRPRADPPTATYLTRRRARLQPCSELCSCGPLVAQSERRHTQACSAGVLHGRRSERTAKPTVGCRTRVTDRVAITRGAATFAPAPSRFGARWRGGVAPRPSAPLWRAQVGSSTPWCGLWGPGRAQRRAVSGSVPPTVGTPVLRARPHAPSLGRAGLASAGAPRLRSGAPGALLLESVGSAASPPPPPLLATPRPRWFRPC